MSAGTVRRPWTSPVAIAFLFIPLAACSTKSPPSSTITPADGPPSEASAFEDITERSGLRFTYRNGEEKNNFAIIESLGGGVALVDFDGDGLLDVFLPAGGTFDGTAVLGHPCKLFRNLGDFRFEDVTAAAGLDAVSFQYSHGAAVLDYDVDGWPDLLVTGYDRLVLLHNVPRPGGGRGFADVTPKSGLTERLWSTSAACGDLDGDGYPDVYVAHYGNWGFATNHPTNCMYDGKTRDVCQPARFTALPHKLYRNNRDGTFTDVTAQTKLRTDGRGVGVVFVDVNNDARPDIYAANDTDDNFLYVNRSRPGTIALDEAGLLAGVARDDRGVANGSMGLDAADFDRSGRASIIVTNYENELPALYRNLSDDRKVRFSFDSLRAGISVIGGNYVSWGTGFFDYDLDGWDDLMIVSGHAIRFPVKIDRRLKPVLFHNDRGHFRVVPTAGWPFFGEPHNARGAAFGDLNNDGRIDVVVSRVNEPVTVLKNVAGAAANWVGIQLECEQRRDPVGGRVVLESSGGRQVKFVKGGGSYGTTNDPRFVFGLGPDTAAGKVTVFWPSGRVQDVKLDRTGLYWKIVENQQPVPIPAK